MPTIKTYLDARAKVLRSTDNPGILAKLAIDLTQKKITEDSPDCKAASRGLLRFILDAKHGSVVEHCSITFLLTGVSRSFLAQITRHRMGSFTSASQHYQDYRDYPMIVHPRMVAKGGEYIEQEARSMMYSSLRDALNTYRCLVDNADIPPQEARQVLPNASAVNIIWTVNARSLENFFYQRLCNRNVDEMSIVATKIYIEACKWWPELFTQVGPACFRGNCDQGKMTCGKVWEQPALPMFTRVGTLDDSIPEGCVDANTIKD